MREVPEAIAAKLTNAAAAFAATFDDLRMDDIALASGIPRATLYYYFSGKDDILAFLLSSTLAELNRALARIAERPGPAKKRLHDLVRSFLAELAGRPAAAQLVFENLGRTGKLPDIATGVQEALYAPFERVLEDGMRNGELARVEPRTVATAMIGSMAIVGLQAIVTEASFDPGQVADLLTRLFWSGVAAQEPRQPRRSS